jgi:hypothetical protein
VSEKELDALESSLGTTLPPRYREFMTRFGPGEYFALVCVHSLDKVRIDDFTSQAFIWANTDKLLTPDEIKHVVLVGYGLNGDWLAFPKGAPKRVLVFPHTDGPIVEVSSFAHALGKYRRDEDS